MTHGGLKDQESKGGEGKYGNEGEEEGEEEAGVKRKTEWEVESRRPPFSFFAGSSHILTETAYRNGVYFQEPMALSDCNLGNVGGGFLSTGRHQAAGLRFKSLGAGPSIRVISFLPFGFSTGRKW